MLLKDLRNLFPMLLTHFSEHYQSLDYLRDVIVTNHQYLLLAEHTLAWGEGHQHFDMIQHVSK